MDDMTLYPGQVVFPSLAGFAAKSTPLAWFSRSSTAKRYYAIDVSGLLPDNDAVTGVINLLPRPAGDLVFSDIAINGNLLSFYATGGRPGVEYALSLSGQGISGDEFDITVTMPIDEASFVEPVLSLSPVITPLTDDLGNILTDESGDEIGTRSKSADQHYADVVTLDTGVINIATPGFAGGNF